MESHLSYCEYDICHYGNVSHLYEYANCYITVDTVSVIDMTSVIADV